MIRNLFAVTALSAVIAMSFLGGARLAQARYVGATTATTVTQPDQWCAGGTIQGTGTTATEICLDFSGNLVPTTTNAQQLGNSTLQYKDVEALNINSGGAAVVIGGAVSLAGQAGLLVQTTSQLLNVTTAPKYIGSTVAVKYLNAAGTANGYGVCMATSTTVQGGAGADSDWIWISTGSATTSLPVGSSCK